MTRQLPLAVALRPEPELDNFIVGDNHQLLAALRQLARQEHPEQLYLTGPSGSGKSHLLMATVKAARDAGWRTAYLPLGELPPQAIEGLESLDLLAFDDLDRIAGDDAWEEALFHLFNQAHALGRRLLFAARRAAPRLPLALPDLQSRLAWGQNYRLEPLDDAGREALLLLQAEKRGLQMRPEAARWMVAHCPRHPRELLERLDHLDRAALAAGRRLTLPFVRQQLTR